MQTVDEGAAVGGLRLRGALRDAAVARSVERLIAADVDDVARVGVEVVREVAGVVEVGDGQAVDVDGRRGMRGLDRRGRLRRPPRCIARDEILLRLFASPAPAAEREAEFLHESRHLGG